MKDSINLTYVDAFARHGEQVVHNLMEDGAMPAAYTWPEPDVTVENWRDKQVIVAKSDGIVVGRAVLSSGYYPFFEIENLTVDPGYRGHGIGSALVDFAVRRAAELGYLAVHLQTEPGNPQAQRLYVRNGFLPATQGSLLRMMRFLSYPALSRFQRDHPLALLQSERGRHSAWELRWHDPVSSDSISLLLSGGSAQADSSGYGPGVAGVKISDSGDACLLEIAGPGEVSKGHEFEIRLKLCNMGEDQITGACRLLLNAGFEPEGASAQSRSISVRPHTETEIAFGVRLLESFNNRIIQVLAYQSVAVSVEFLIGHRVFWLSHEVKPATAE